MRRYTVQASIFFYSFLSLSHVHAPSSPSLSLSLSRNLLLPSSPASFFVFSHATIAQEDHRPRPTADGVSFAQDPQTDRPTTNGEALITAPRCKDFLRSVKCSAFWFQFSKPFLGLLHISLSLSPPPASVPFTSFQRDGYPKSEQASYARV